MAMASRSDPIRATCVPADARLDFWVVQLDEIEMPEPRFIIVGDVHGMLSELEALIRHVSLQKSDTLVMAGDLLDRGPDSAGVVSCLCDLKTAGHQVVLVKGNHEEKHERFRNAYRRVGKPPKMTNAAEIGAITDQLGPEQIAFLDSARLFFTIPEHNALVVHAGILPWMDAIPTQEQIDAMPGKQKAKWSQALRVRHVRGKDEQSLTLEVKSCPPIDVDESECSANTIQTLNEARGNILSVMVKRNEIKPRGQFIPLNRATSEDPFWAEVYDGRFGHVYFGHEPFLDGVRRFPHATGLDTGAVFGGSLSAAILESDRAPDFVSVKSGQKFAEIARSD